MKKLKISFLALMVFALTAGVTFASNQKTSEANDCWSNEDNINDGHPDVNSAICTATTRDCCYTSQDVLLKKP